MKVQNVYPLLALLFVLFVGYIFIDNDIEVVVQSIPLEERINNAPGFEKIIGSEIGIDEHDNYAKDTLIIPFMEERGISAADLNNDWQDDILVALKSKVLLYENIGENSFKKRMLLEFDEGSAISIVATADLNNDGWLDLYIGFFDGTERVAFSTEGNFDAIDSIFFSNTPEHTAVTGVTFGDINKDGLLDFTPAFMSLQSRNEIVRKTHPVYLNRGDSTFEVSSISHNGGLTLSVLLSDINQDGNLDLLFGEDFRVVDEYFYGDGRGNFTLVSEDEGMFEMVAEATMSIDVADIDNDLDMDLYLVGIGEGTSPRISLHQDTKEQYCEGLEGVHYERCLQETELTLRVGDVGIEQLSLSEGDCDLFEGEYAVNCLAHRNIFEVFDEREESLCGLIPETYTGLHRLACRGISALIVEEESTNDISSLKEKASGNVLLVQGEEFKDESVTKDIEHTGFGWNAIFADLNNDEWLDLYAVNGWNHQDRKESHMTEQNVFFKNSGGTFEEMTNEYGLDDHFIAWSYAYLDINSDGALDIVLTPRNYPAILYTNNSGGNAIEIALRDEIGNYFGIGSVVTVSYGNGKKQIRELKTGGGYKSSLPHKLHFGLAEHQVVDSISVRWSTGEETLVRGPFQANHRHVITRNR